MARCIGLEKDKKLLQSELEKWENNAEHLVSDYPELMRQWSEKNGLLKPEKVTMGSNRKVWRVCEKGHEWQATVRSRVSGAGCPICSGREPWKGHDDLATTHPQLVKQWHPYKNGRLTPEKVKAGCHKKVWWVCEKGHEWQVPVYGARRLILGHDYIVACPDGSNVDPGTAVLTIIDTGNYKDSIQERFIITSDPVQPVEGMKLSVTPDQWVYDGVKIPQIQVTFHGVPMQPQDYTLTVEKDGQKQENLTIDQAAAVLKEPGEYTVTSQGLGSYSQSSDSQTVTIHKIRPVLNITVSPASLSGGGKAVITLIGNDLPAGTDLTTLLSVATASGTDLDLSKLTWQQQGGKFTADFDAPNANETYTFTLEFAGDGHHESASDTATLVTAQWSGGGGGGGIGTAYTITASAGEHGSISPSGKVSVVKGADAAFVFQPEEGYKVTDVLVDGVSVGAVGSYTFEKVSGNHTILVTFVKGSDVADPTDTGVADWLITGEHIQYLSGYGEGPFGPTDAMTRAQAAQMFYNLLLEKDIPITTSFCYSICVFCLKGRGKRHNTGGERKAERSGEWLWPLCREKQYDKIKNK